MGFNFVKFVTLLKTELRVEPFLLLLFFEVCGKSAPRKLYWYGTLVDYFIVLVGKRVIEVGSAVICVLER